MKKLIALIMMVIIVFAMTACGGGDSATTPDIPGEWQTVALRADDGTDLFVEEDDWNWYHFEFNEDGTGLDLSMGYEFEITWTQAEDETLTIVDDFTGEEMVFSPNGGTFMLTDEDDWEFVIGKVE